MTTDADFKALVRARMAQTGQTYTAARADLLLRREATGRDHPMTDDDAATATAASAATAAVAASAATAASAEPIRSRPTITSAAAERTPDEVFRDKTLRAFFDGERLRSIPAKRKARVVVLLELLRRFEPGRTYAEREVNDLLRASHDDVASLRRELVDYRYLERADGRYWVTNRDPVRDANETQEVPAGEADLLAAMRSPAPSQSGRQAPPR
ncbi:MAG TPA: DUF2087 domain-containing protein [Dermatophilaceae bacterium]|nr:DUF2087 domain-containing protein [Dermatophilaceae bacterium]